MIHGLPSGSTSGALREREVHVWRVLLDGLSPSVERRSACLSRDEIERSAQFALPQEQRRFILSRIVLRDVLARYHGAPAADIPLAREAGGRPFVQGAERLFFSLSHTAGVALIAVADRAVGVDVERVRRVPRAAAIARRVLHPDTVALLETLPGPDFASAFLDAWTLREAHVKAVGGGLFRTADVLPFDPRLADDATVHAVASRADGARWSVARFLPYASTRAALAAPGILHRIRIMDWNDTPEEGDS